MGVASLSKVMSTNPTEGGGSMGTTSGSNTPAPQMMSGAFELTGGMAPDPLRAFVVTDEMTSSQAQLANIRRRATI
jgi:formiminotetrahydrofolate cyclodeaminase